MAVRLRSGDWIIASKKASAVTRAKSSLQCLFSASASLVAMSVTLGWSDSALATGSCGSPSKGSVDCTNTNYSHGIEYIAGDAVEDLTVAVGTAAGQSSPVTISGGITIGSPPFSYSSIKETLDVGSNVSIASSGDGEFVEAASFVYSATHAIAGSAVEVSNAGNVVARGDYHNGVQALAVSYADALTYSGSAIAMATSSIQNTGTIDVSGRGVSGIVATSYAVIGSISDPLYSESMASTAINNSGSVTRSGSGGTYRHSLGAIEAVAFSYALGAARSYSSGTTTVSNTGAIRTGGDYDSGIYAVSVSKAVSLYNSRSVATTSVVNDGGITDPGASTKVINAYAFSGADTLSSKSFANAVAQSTVVNAGSITAISRKGLYSYAIYSRSIAASISIGDATVSAASGVTNSGAIRVSGSVGAGITSAALSEALAYQRVISSATAALVNTGAINISSSETVDGLAVSATAAGKSAYSSTNLTSSVSLKNFGAITVNGGSYSAGIKAEALVNASGPARQGTPGPIHEKSSATVSNSANVSAFGNGAIGILGIANTVTIVNAAGVITGGSGIYAKGIYTGGQTAIVNNGGSIGSQNDRAVDMYSHHSSTLSNVGTITGTVTMRSATNTFDNSGLWVVRGTDSSFYAGPGGSSIVVNMGKMAIIGNQTLEDLDLLTNSGLIDMTQASSFGLGLRPAVETLEVSGDYVGVGGTLAIDADPGAAMADVLKIDGSASGGTRVATTIIGAPGQTIGNGILVVEAANGATANEFALAGNSSGHTEVAGAFEYNLDFVPGMGTSGDWYLQSHIYPGTYQFGQIGSSALIIGDQVNADLSDLLGQMNNVQTASASLDKPVQLASADNGFMPQPGGGSLSGWGRYEESRFEIDPSGSSVADYKLRVDTAQFGLDDAWHNADNRLVFGGYVAPFHSWANFTKFGAAEIGSSGDAYALFGLWFSGRWQAGLRLNYDSDTAHFSDNYIGTNASLKTPEEGVQAAASYSMQFDWANFDPSLELNYGRVRGGSIADGVSDTVRIGDTSDFWGKFNGRFSWDVETDHNLLVQPYVNLALLYRGNTNTTVDIDTFGLSTNVNGWNGDVALGVNASLAANLAMFAQMGYVAGDRIKGVTGFLGLQYAP